MVQVTKEYMDTHEACIENRLKQAYGVTAKVSDGGYILIDGSMLDFKDPKARMVKSSEDIERYLSTSTRGKIVPFLLRGNIRMKHSDTAYTVELMQAPTPEQVQALKKVKRSALASKRKFVINVLAPIMSEPVMFTTDRIEDFTD